MHHPLKTRTGPEKVTPHDAGSAHVTRSREVLAGFLERYPRIAVLSGAGCSTGSGIPDYRDDDGNWKHRRPVQYADFVRCADVRRRYWAQSFHGWQRIADAEPNAAHRALARLERAGRLSGLITQNVDDLHRRAGSRNVVDLHGVLHRVRCLACHQVIPRAAFQRTLARANAGWDGVLERPGPDGDSVLSTTDFRGFNVPACPSCNGVIKPDVVFFGEAVPQQHVLRAAQIIASAGALLIVGSSLMVFSGFRFARMAAEAGLPIGIINRGLTRADGLARFRLADDCGTVLDGALAAIDA